MKGRRRWADHEQRKQLRALGVSEHLTGYQAYRVLRFVREYGRVPAWAHTINKLEGHQTLSRTSRDGFVPRGDEPQE